MGNLPRGNINRVIGLHRYVQLLDTLKGHSGSLYAHVSPVAIKDGNKAVRNASQTKGTALSAHANIRK